MTDNVKDLNIVWDKREVEKRIFAQSAAIGPDGKPSVTVYYQRDYKANAWVLIDAENWA